MPEPEPPQLLSPPEAAAYAAIRAWLATHEATGIATPEAARRVAAAVLGAEQQPPRLFLAPIAPGTLAHRLATWWGTRPQVMRWRTRHWQDVGYTTDPQPWTTGSPESYLAGAVEGLIGQHPQLTAPDGTVLGHATVTDAELDEDGGLNLTWTMPGAPRTFTEEVAAGDFGFTIGRPRSPDDPGPEPQPAT